MLPRNDWAIGILGMGEIEIWGMWGMGRVGYPIITKSIRARRRYIEFPKLYKVTEKCYAKHYGMFEEYPIRE